MVAFSARRPASANRPRYRANLTGRGGAVIAFLLLAGMHVIDGAHAGDGQTSTQSAQVSIRVARNVAIALTGDGHAPLALGNLAIPFFTGPALLTWRAGQGSDGHEFAAGCGLPDQEKTACASSEISRPGTTAQYDNINLIPESLRLNGQEVDPGAPVATYVMVSALP